MSRKKTVYDDTKPDETIFYPAERNNRMSLELNIYRVPEEEMPLEQRRALARVQERIARGAISEVTQIG